MNGADRKELTEQNENETKNVWVCIKHVCVILSLYKQIQTDEFECYNIYALNSHLFIHLFAFIFPLNLTILLGQCVAVHIEINANKKTVFYP